MSDEPNVDFGLMQRLTKEIRQEISHMRSEMRDGFAGLRTHRDAVMHDVSGLETRIALIEDKIATIETTQGINAD